MIRVLQAAFLTCILFSCTSFSPVADRQPSQTNSSNWAKLLDQGMPKDLTFGVILGGVDPFERNPDELMAPASVSKVITSGAALSALGEDYRFPTILRWQQKSGQATNLKVTGHGDPTWGMEEFGYSIDEQLDELAKALFEQGVREVDENILWEADSRWQKISFPAGWKDTDGASCDGSLGQAFNLSANCASFTVTGPSKGEWKEAGLNAPVKVRLSPGKKTSLVAELVQPTPETYEFLITGTWGRSAKKLFLPIHDTRSWAAELFRRSLKKHQITVRSLRLEPSEVASKEFTLYSPKLSEILQPFNKNSINFLGDSFLKAIGAADANADFRESGLLRLSEYLSSAGISSGHQINDGSGLSRTSRISPRMAFGYLSFLTDQPYFSALLKSLAIAGTDGTLKDRMNGPPTEGVLRAKTGTLDGVYNLAGFVPRGSGYVPFVLFTRTAANRGAQVRPALDRVGRQLTKVNSRETLVADPASEKRFPFVKEHSGENYR